MYNLRRSNERGSADHGWLHSQHTFSFADYYDPKFMGFRSLRVINEDWIDGGTGFGSHPHRDMEIISYVSSGALEHKDSMGNVTIIRPDEVQRMSAGTGVVHSEYNKMLDQKTHLLQIWIQPIQKGGAPGYAQKSFANDLREKDKVLVVSKDGRDGSLTLNQDANIFISRLAEGKSIQHILQKGRGLWIQFISGAATLKTSNEKLKLNAGDGIAIESESEIEIQALAETEFIIFDLG